MRIYLLSYGIDVNVNDIAQFALREVGDAHDSSIAVQLHPFVIFGVLESLGNVHGFCVLPKIRKIAISPQSTVHSPQLIRANGWIFATSEDFLRGPSRTTHGHRLWTIPLLRQAEPHLNAKPGGGAGIGVGDQRLVNRPFEVALHGKFLIANVADSGAQLEINVAIGNRTEVVNFALDRFVVADGKVHPEGYVILQYDGSALRFERQLPVVF